MPHSRVPDDEDTIPDGVAIVDGAAGRSIGDNDSDDGDDGDHNKRQAPTWRRVTGPFAWAFPQSSPSNA